MTRAEIEAELLMIQRRGAVLREMKRKITKQEMEDSGRAAALNAARDKLHLQWATGA
jgi:hypothetical protein